MKPKIKVVSYGEQVHQAYPVGEDMLACILLADKYSEELKPLIFDTDFRVIDLWVRGSSGAILGSLLAANLPLDELEINVKYVRKEGERSHGSNTDLCCTNRALSIIVDDFVDTGKTINAIYKMMSNIFYRREVVDKMRTPWLVVNNILAGTELNFVPPVIVTSDSGRDNIKDNGELTNRSLKINWV